MPDSDAGPDGREPAREVAVAGERRPDLGDPAELARSLAGDLEPADSVLLARLALSADRDRAFADRLVATLGDQLTVVGSSVSAGEDEGLGLDVLVETDHDPQKVAAELAGIDDVRGAVVAEVVVPGRPTTPATAGDDDRGGQGSQGGPADGARGDPAEAGAAAAAREPADEEAERTELSIYRLDDHLVVTDDVGAFLERLYAELDDDLLRRAVAASVEPFREDLDATAARLDELERRLDELEAAAEEISEVRAAAEAARERTRDLETELAAVGGALEDKADADELRSVTEQLEGKADAEELAVLARRIEGKADAEELAAVAEEVQSRAAADELAELRERLERDVPTTGKIKQVFAPAARRVGGEGRHPTMADAVEEIDDELRRTHALREAGLVGRLRWLVTGGLPAADEEDDPDDAEADGE